MIVVTRHKALVEYLKEINLVKENVRVISHAVPKDITGQKVIGVLPHSLSCLTESYTEVPLFVPVELRGKELTLEQIREYAQEPATYKVKQIK